MGDVEDSYDLEGKQNEGVGVDYYQLLNVSRGVRLRASTSSSSALSTSMTVLTIVLKPASFLIYVKQLFSI